MGQRLTRDHAAVTALAILTQARSSLVHGWTQESACMLYGERGHGNSSGLAPRATLGKALADARMALYGTGPNRAPGSDAWGAEAARALRSACEVLLPWTPSYGMVRGRYQACIIDVFNELDGISLLDVMTCVDLAIYLLGSPLTGDERSVLPSCPLRTPATEPTSAR